ncbi:hypothetical protein H2200_010968 [Cladophialophora chaetospira]|uniref:Scramblase family protein n=1 Tax=Cladophialophora chaetospira TaxID=386627 RepID=A0AA39CE15_9EURO|nr:hypothetical protein H2200_010968 [Cladophialophora chaetospira]
MAKAMFLLARPACAAVKPPKNISFVYRSFAASSRRLASPSPGPRKNDDASSSAQQNPPPKPPSIDNVLANTDPKDNPLLAPVHIPEDANAILKSNHPAADLLTQSAIVVQRQLEMMNVLIGFEQANRYVILDPQGNHIGYMAEHDGGIGHSMKRQFLNTHRAFTTHVFDRNSREVLRFHRPFSWINTRIRVYDPWNTPSFEASASTQLAESNPDLTPQPQLSPVPLEAMRVIGETHSQWAPLRRKYDLFISHPLSLGQQDPGGINGDVATMRLNQGRSGSTTDFAQFARVDEPFLSWDFSLRDENLRNIGSVNREFRGFGREIFTDTGSYVLRMDAASDQAASDPNQPQRAYNEALGGDKIGMTLDQRAVMLATAVTVDYDYFSRHSGGHGFFPIWLVGGGGEAAGGAAGAGAAGAGGAAEAGGAVVGGAGRAVGTAAGGATGVGEGAIAGAGTMAGYEAMQRGMGRGSETAADDASPQAQPPEQPSGQPLDQQSPESGFGQQNQEDVWGSSESDPWSEAAQTGGSAGSGGGEGGGWLSSLWDSFWDS